MIEMFLDYLLSESGLQIDPARRHMFVMNFMNFMNWFPNSRLYVTGHSMGGAGALFAASSGRLLAEV